MTIKQSWKTVLVLVTLLATFGLATVAYAHGVVITYAVKANGEVTLHAEFDTGEAMSEAQVTIYSPEDLLKPWLTGIADAEGNYTFVVNPEILGTWDVQFRKAGHGDIIHFQLEEGMIDPALMVNPPGELLAAKAVETNAEAIDADVEIETDSAAEGASSTQATEAQENTVISSGGNTATNGGFSSLQILLMSASVIWGFVGTALYFSGNKTQAHDHTH